MSNQIGYIVIGDGKPMEWVVDRYNYGFYFGKSATLFPNYATARRRIEQDKKEYAASYPLPRYVSYRILRITTEAADER